MSGDTPEDPRSAEDAPPPSSAEWTPGRRLARVVAIDAAHAVAPPECACCGRAGTRTLRATSLGGKRFQVPYCSDCHAHASADETRALAVTIASSLLAATFLVGMPLVFQPSSALPYALVVLACGFLPGTILSFVPRRTPAEHSAAGRAVFFRWDGVLVCRSAEWAERLASVNGAKSEPAFAAEPSLTRWGAPVLVLVGLLAVPFFQFHFPEVRVVNVAPERLTIFVDGRPRLSVAPTSEESPTAGAVLRVPAGRRTLRAVDPTGAVVDDASVLVQGGEPHLYAPGSAGTCFWIEARGYGKRAREEVPPNVPLGGVPRFWVIPSGVDYWFSPPPVGDADERSTGGVLKALRQARCDDVERDRTPSPP